MRSVASSMIGWQSINLDRWASLSAHPIIHKRKSDIIPQKSEHWRNKMNAVISLDDEKTKALLTEIMVDLIKNKREVLHEIMLDVLEEVALANAIIEDRNDDFVSEDEIFAILK
ncbi:MAG: hypothetical protein Q7U23_05145 [Methylococcales bacterium]|nr:hypothetical protein [Methylococcales bacterium]